jgi:hypothetical protein
LLTALIVPKDYGINGCLPAFRRVPSNYSVSFWPVQYTHLGFLFSPFFFWKKLLRKGAKEKKQLTKFFNAKNFQKMKTAEKNAKGVQGTTAKNNEAAKVQNRPNIPGKEKNDEPAKDQKPAETSQAEAAKNAPAETHLATAVGHQPADTAAEPAKQEVKADEPKAEIKYIKPVPNLEQTLKAVDSLHRKGIQRLALIARIKTLEGFEIKLVEENDELESNPYQGCKLIIEDDKKRQFVTNTPNLIRMVSQFIYDACEDKLAEIEAEIVFPNA